MRFTWVLSLRQPPLLAHLASDVVAGFSQVRLRWVEETRSDGIPCGLSDRSDPQNLRQHRKIKKQHFVAQDIVQAGKDIVEPLAAGALRCRVRHRSRFDGL
jgi:hypothetical protein